MASSVSDIEAVRIAVTTATQFVSVFGPLGDGDEESRQRALRSAFNKLARTVHPDVAPAGAEKLATETFALLMALRESAEAAITAGTYGKPFRAGNAPAAPPSTSDDGATLESATAVYRLEKDPRWSGDFSSLYRAVTLSASSAPVLIKLADAPGYNQYLERELDILSRAAKEPKKFGRILPYLPAVADTFLVAGDAGKRFRAVAYRTRDGVRSLAEIRSALGGSLKPVETGWMLRRIIAQTLLADMLGVVHGAIVPDHVLLHPLTREPLHIGWAHAAHRARGERITTVMDRWRAFYPHEVMDRKEPDHRTDLYMAAKTCLWLVGGDVERNRFPAGMPASVTKILLSCMSEKRSQRPGDGRDVLDALTREIRTAWGRSYHPLDVPSR